MKRTGKILTTILAFCLAFSLGGVNCLAAQTSGQDEPYTYTFTLQVGKHGTIADGAAQRIRERSGGALGEATVTVDQSSGVITVSGLSYNSQVIFQAQELVNIPENGKYYAKGIRQSGRDDSSGIASCKVTGDRDYVVAYGVKGDMVSYVVNYQDTEGNALAESNTYYGNVGDRPVVAFRYIEGYEPQAYNLTKTLTANTVDNVFTFIYKPIPAGGETTVPGGQGPTGGDAAPVTPPAGGTTTVTPGGTTTPGGTVTPTPGTPAPAGPVAPAGPDADDNPAVPDDGPGNDDGLGDNDGPGTDGPVEVPDDEVPLDEGPQELVDLDDDEVPLADFFGDDDGLLGNRTGAVAVAVGIVGAAALAGILIWLWMQKRKKKEEARQ